DLVPVDRQDRRLDIGSRAAECETFDVFAETNIYHLSGGPNPGPQSDLRSLNYRRSICGQVASSLLLLDVGTRLRFAQNQVSLSVVEEQRVYDHLGRGLHDHRHLESNEPEAHLRQSCRIDVTRCDQANQPVQRYKPGLHGGLPPPEGTLPR